MKTNGKSKKRFLCCVAAMLLMAVSAWGTSLTGTGFSGRSGTIAIPTSGNLVRRLSLSALQNVSAASAAVSDSDSSLGGVSCTVDLGAITLTGVTPGAAVTVQVFATETASGEKLCTSYGSGSTYTIQDSGSSHFAYYTTDAASSDGTLTVPAGSFTVTPSSSSVSALSLYIVLVASDVTSIGFSIEASSVTAGDATASLSSVSGVSVEGNADLSVTSTLTVASLTSDTYDLYSTSYTGGTTELYSVDAQVEAAYYASIQDEPFYLYVTSIDPTGYTDLETAQTEKFAFSKTVTYTGGTVTSSFDALVKLEGSSTSSGSTDWLTGDDASQTNYVVLPYPTSSSDTTYDWSGGLYVKLASDVVVDSLDAGDYSMTIYLTLKMV